MDFQIRVTADRATLVVVDPRGVQQARILTATTTGDGWYYNEQYSPTVGGAVGDMIDEMVGC